MRAFADFIALIFAACAVASLLYLFSVLTDFQFVSLSLLLSERFSSFLAVSLMLVVYFLFKGHYHMRMPFWRETEEVTASAFMALLLEGFLIYANKADVSRLSVFLTWIAAPFFVMWVRALIRRTRLAGASSAALIFGDERHANRAMDIFRSDSHMGVVVVGVSSICPADVVAAQMAASKAELAILALSGNDEREISLAADLRRSGIDVCVVTPAMGMSAGMNVQYVLGKDAMLLAGRPRVAPVLSRIAKRAFDILVSLIALVALAIPMSLLAVAVFLSDRGSPFFAHERIGEGGKRFKCLKFRSMRVNSQEMLDRYLRENPDAAAAWESSRKLPDDPRITAIGRLIRKTSADELPQLFNVIKGDMSLVGPRPVTEDELRHYGSSSELYTSVKPGVTGLWQVSGRSDVSYERRVALDAWYVENWSPWHDIAILAKTIPAVLATQGAY